MELFVTKVFDSLNQKRFTALLHALDQEKQSTIRSITNPHVARIYLTSALLARFIIRRMTGLRNDEIIFEKNAYDKPILKGYADVHFNMSHSGDWIVGAIDSTAIGIDIEKRDTIHSHKFPLDMLSHQEKLHYDTLTADEKICYFYTVWTAKESYLKASGVGMNAELKNFSMTPESDPSYFIITNTDAPEEMANYHIKVYQELKSYALAVCAQGKNFPHRINRVDEGDIICPIS